ncbi:TetR/AcrR family transcriptional regulator [Pseudomonas vancouverensis]|uniref:TetR/AcrR family transcriptional regulator n=1 Tax=Pseudomonas vancouverensis TaxID=95300 RepID=UPI003D0928AE
MSRIRQHNLNLLLEAASAEFAAKGFDAAQTRDIAARAGVPKANLYYYFQSKENLYGQVLLGFVQPLLDASAALRESDDPVAGLQAYIAARIRIAREHPHIAKVFSGELLLGAKQLPAECRDLLYAEARRNVECLRSWIDRGLLAPVDPEHLMLFIWSATRTYTNLGWQMACITGREVPQDEDYANAAATITRLVLGGVGMEGVREERVLMFAT